MPWIRLTDTANEPAWVNTDHFHKMIRNAPKTDEPYTILTGISGTGPSSTGSQPIPFMVCVRETPEQIRTLISPS